MRRSSWIRRVRSAMCRPSVTILLLSSRWTAVMGRWCIGRGIGPTRYNSCMTRWVLRRGDFGVSRVYTPYPCHESGLELSSCIKGPLPLHWGSGPFCVSRSNLLRLGRPGRRPLCLRSRPPTVTHICFPQSVQRSRPVASGWPNRPEPAQRAGSQDVGAHHNLRQWPRQWYRQLHGQGRGSLPAASSNNR